MPPESRAPRRRAHDGRWEVGSAFPLMLPPGDGPGAAFGRGRFFGSGRQALRALVEFGRREYGWRSVHVPAYYSPSVVPHLAGLLPVRRYDTGPRGPRPRPDADAADLVVVASYFGEPPPLPSTGATVVVDATHDPLAPWLDRVPADYVFASLHKTLPLPDGGVLWSGRGCALPPAPPPAERHLAAVSRTLAAMCLKTAYLDGAPVSKERYLALYAAGDAGLGGTAVSGISDFSREALRVLPVPELRRRRLANAAQLVAGLADLPGAVAGAHPFGVVLEFDAPHRRDAVRDGLIARNVYPAVLWDLAPDSPPHQVDLSRRLLHLHTDARWSGDDMQRVAEIVRGLCRRYAPEAPLPTVPSPAERPDPMTAPPGTAAR